MVPELKDTRRVRLDNKGRISLPKELCIGISSFVITCEPGGRIVLEPFAEIPARELWLHQNPAAKEQVQRGLAQSAAGQTVSRGSFAPYASADPNDASSNDLDADDA
jgi:DNA-binding transcriptional regulator/RsmH inhibitor MraZ